MPTLRTDKGNRWMARVVIDGKQVACMMFPPGKKHGSEWRQAKQWEEEERKKALAVMGYNPQSNRKQEREFEKAQKEAQIQMDLERLFSWGDDYLEHAKRVVRLSTYKEKQFVMKEFFTFCRKQNILSLQDVTTAKCYAFLSYVNDARGGHMANMYRRNLLTAWKWGMDFIEDFPQMRPPFQRIKLFAVVKKDKYVPPEDDIIKVLNVAKGQDFVMLLLLYFTGARKSEAFRLTWEDINFKEEKIRLKDYKSGNGQERVRWLRLHPELIKALLWWKDARPCKVNNVFMQIQSNTRMGEAFSNRSSFMTRLCKRAGVKFFSFHAIRHKSAAITYTESDLNAAQALVGHARPTTTDRYTKSAGLYSEQNNILSALGNSDIGQVVGDLLETKIPQV